MINRAIGLMRRVLATGPGDRGSIIGQVIPKSQKMLLDAPLLNTQHYMVGIKGKVEQYRKSSSTPLHLEKGAFGSLSTIIANFTLLYPHEEI